MKSTPSTTRGVSVKCSQRSRAGAVTSSATSVAVRAHGEWPLRETVRRGLRDRFGDTLLDEATLHDEYASIERAVPHSPDRVMPYSYRGTFESDHSPTTRPVGTPEFDLDALDVPLLARYLAGAPSRWVCRTAR